MSDLTQSSPTKDNPQDEIRISHFDICPSCGDVTLAYEEGCSKCYGCGYAEC